MIVFRDIKSGIIIGCNYKVMYSFFCISKRYQKLCSTEKSPPLIIPEYLIIRHPFERIVSCFYDKCRVHCQNNFKIQESQVLFANILGLKSPFHLQSISFEIWIEKIDRMKIDPHLLPQTYNIENIVNNIKLIMMEKDLSILGKIIDEDFSKKENSTKHPSWEFLIPKNMRKSIYNIYITDFNAFGNRYNWE
jgi:hypothetical protein